MDRKKLYMRILFCFLLFFTVQSFAQKMPVGLIIQFDGSADYATQEAEIAQAKGLKKLKAEHVLKGFGVTLAESESNYLFTVIFLVMIPFSVDS
jgi:hypothetical protein